MELQDKISKSATALGVFLEIPAFVDPATGFTNSKVVTWENGDKIKVVVDFVDGAFQYRAFLGQIDPKVGELAFITGEIANAPSLEGLITAVDNYLTDIAANSERDYDPAPEIVDDYLKANDDYQEIIMDPDHTSDQVKEVSQRLLSLESKLRENGYIPSKLKRQLYQ